MSNSDLRMSRLCCFALSALIIGFAGGCEKESDIGGPGGIAPGGVKSNEVVPGGIPPGTTTSNPNIPSNNRPNPTGDTNPNNAENTFVLTVPSGQVDITQGESQNVSVGIDRGSIFNQAVEVSVSASAPGVTVEPTKTTLNAGQTEVEFMLKVSADAPVGLTNIKVDGKPQNGKSVTTTIQLQINEN